MEMSAAQPVGPLSESTPPALPVSAAHSDVSPGAPEFSPGVYITMLVTAAATGLSANLLLASSAGVGLNLLLTVLCFIGGWFLIARQAQVPVWRKVCAGAAVIYAGAIAVRASEILMLVNLALLLGFVGLACSPDYTSRIKRVWTAVLNTTEVIVNLLFGSFLFFTQVPLSSFDLKNPHARTASRVLLGFGISLPFLLLFGVLFSQAEVRFEALFSTFFTTLYKAVFTNFWVTVFTAVFSLGLLRGAFLVRSGRGVFSELERKAPVPIGYIESVTVLGLLNLLFLIFVITQIPYLFGGQAKVSSTANLGWSEYARRGFFELAWVAALLIPTLMFFMGCASEVPVRQRRILHFMGAGLSALTGVIIVSALQRMLLYTQNFGLTELRIYVSIFIVMLGLIIILFNVLSFRGQLDWFLAAALATGFVFSIGMQVPNVQAMVAADALGKAGAPDQKDLLYVGTLSTDAVPTIMRSSLAPAEKRLLSEQILNRRTPIPNTVGVLEQPLSVVLARRAMNGTGVAMP